MGILDRSSKEDRIDETHNEVADSRRDRGVRSRIIRNVLSNWVAHSVIIVSGFVLPRFISDQQGQNILGVWDFGWSLVVYIEFLVLGLSGAVERYVSRYRSLEDWAALGRTVSSAFAVLLVSFLLGLCCVSGLVYVTPALLHMSDPHIERQAQMIVAILGTSCALRLLMVPFRSVITGSERFDVSSLINGSLRAVQLVSMVLLLLAGHNIVSLAWVVLCVQCLEFAATMGAVRCVCPALHLSLRGVSWAAGKELLGFGGKALIYQVSHIAAYQTNMILTVWALGPAMLAVYARQRALLMHTDNILLHYARTLTPVASAYHAKEDRQGLARLMVQASLYGLCILLPICACLMILGGPILEVWMGSSYQAPVPMILLVLGHVVLLSQRGTISILLGMARHGLPAMAMLGSSVVSIMLGMLLLRVIPLGLNGAAIALGISFTFGVGFFLAIYGCRSVRLTLWDYLRQSLPKPLIMVAPFVAWLIIARCAVSGPAVTTLTVALLPGGVILGLVYWRWVIPVSIRERILRSVMGGKRGDARK